MTQVSQYSVINPDIRYLFDNYKQIETELVCVSSQKME